MVILDQHKQREMTQQQLKDYKSATAICKNISIIENFRSRDDPHAVIVGQNWVDIVG